MRIESLRDLHSQFPDVDGFWNHENLATTEANIRQSLPQFENKGDWGPAAQEAVTHLIRVLDLQGKPADADALIEQARNLIITENKSTPTRAQLKFILEEGRHLCLSMMPSKAQNYFLQAWKMAVEMGEELLAIETAVMMSITLPPKSQTEWLQKALALAEKSKNERAKLWLAQLYLMSGWHAFDLRRYDEALEKFNKALARPREQGEMTSVVVIKWCIARCLRALNRIQEALDMQLALMSENKNTGSVNGHIYLEIAECLQLLQKTNDAKPYFELAHKELSLNLWYADNKDAELTRMQELYKKK